MINLFQLILLKYIPFNIYGMFQLFNGDIAPTIFSKIIVPVGISFFTLQGIGYLININMGWEKPEKNFIHFLLYIIFYPRFLSGPIDRSNLFLPQLKESQPFNQHKVIEGLRLVLFGLFKKVAIANQLAPLIISTYANIELTDGNSLLLVFLIQPIYIYFDFSGYTDIAMGFARAFGIELRPNFNRPFMAESVTEFWKRFHISLSSWFRDYIFMRIVFKYRKRGKHASTIGLFVTWILFGIWHGAGVNFMVLGLLQAIAMYYEFSTLRWRVKYFSRLPDTLRKWMGRLITYLFYAVSLVFFFSSDLHSVVVFFSNLPTLDLIIPEGIRKEIFLLVMFFAIVFLVIEIIQNDFGKKYSDIEFSWYKSTKAKNFVRWALYFVLITVIIVLNKEVQQFIYFQF